MPLNTVDGGTGGIAGGCGVTSVVNNTCVEGNWNGKIRLSATAAIRAVCPPSPPPPTSGSWVRRLTMVTAPTGATRSIQKQGCRMPNPIAERPEEGLRPRSEQQTAHGTGDGFHRHKRSRPDEMGQDPRRGVLRQMAETNVLERLLNRWPARVRKWRNFIPSCSTAFWQALRRLTGTGLSLDQSGFLLYLQMSIPRIVRPVLQQVATRATLSSTPV